MDFRVKLDSSNVNCASSAAVRRSSPFSDDSALTIESRMTA